MEPRHTPHSLTLVEKVISKQRDNGIRFATFPMGRWVVRWIGDIGFHLPHISTSQPMVSILLEELLERKLGARLEVGITAAQLLLVPLGSVWEDKVRIDDVFGDEIELDFDVSKTLLCQAGGIATLTGGIGHLLPFSYFDYHKDHTKIWCVKVEIGKTIAVIPTYEIIRFYYGSSGGLLRTVLSAKFSRESLYTSAEMRSRRLGRIELRSGMSIASAPDIARIAFDEAAFRSAALTSRSLQIASTEAASHSRIYPKAAFPFSGSASLVVRGTHIGPRSNILTSRFLVQEILACRKPFPFRTLEYIGASGTKKVGGAFSHMQGTRTNDRKNPPNQTREPGVGPDEPRKSDQAKNIVWDRAIRFPDLIGKKIFRTDIPTQGQIHLGRYPDNPFEGTGAGKSTGTSRRIDPIRELDDRELLMRLTSPTPAWQVYFDFLKLLAAEKSLRWIRFVRGDPRQVRSHFLELPEMSDDDGVLIPETLRLRGSEDDTEKLIHRRASFVNILIDDTVHALVSLCPIEPEQDNLVIHWPDKFIEPSHIWTVFAASFSSDQSSGRQSLRIGSDYFEESFQLIKSASFLKYAVPAM